MRTVASLSSQRNKLISDATDQVERGLHTAEQKAQHKSQLAEIDLIQTDIDALTHIERSLPKPAIAPVIVAAPAIISETTETRRKKVNAAYRHFFINGADPISPEQRAGLLTTNASGEAAIEQGFDEIFIEAAKYFGPVWNLVHRKDCNGEPTKFVTSDDTARTFSLLTEGTTTAGSAASQPTIFSNVNDTDTLISSVTYSLQELEDAFDLESFLIRNAGLAVSRAHETAITLGTTNDGSATALPNGAGGLLASVGTGVTQTGGSLAAGPTYAQLSALAGSVDRAYFANGSFAASPSVETFLRSAVDSTGRALYPIDPATGLLVIAGRLLYPNSAMPAAGTASSKLVLFGDYNKAWNVLNAGLRIKVVGQENAAMNFLTRQMVIWTRIGQSAGLSTAVKALVSAAS